MEEFKRLLEKVDKLKPSTIKNYVARLSFVEKTLGMPIDEIHLDDVKEITSTLESTGASNESMRAYITAIIKYLRLLHGNAETLDEYMKFHKTLSMTVKDINMKNELSEKEEKSYIPFEEMKQKFIEWYDLNKEKPDFNWNDALFIGNFLLLKAPVRLGNWRNMKVVYIDKTNMREKLKQLDDTFNYLLVVSHKNMFEFIYVFNDYKTSAFLGDINVVVEDPRLKEMVMKVALVINDGDFINNIQQSVQSNKFKRIAKRIFGVEFSVDAVRHSFISDMYDNKRVSAAERKEILTLFGHVYQPSTTDLYYRKTKNDKKIDLNTKE